MHKPNTMHHSHPFSIALYLSKFLFLLILPLLRSFIAALRGGLTQWFRSAWLDVIAVVLLLVLSTLRWLRFQYKTENNTIYLTYGIFLHRKLTLSMRRISALSVLSSVWLRPFGIVKLRMDTPAKGKRKADFAFYVKKPEAERLLSLRGDCLPRRTSAIRTYRPEIWNTVLLSLFTSNSLPGILMLSTFVSHAGKLLGEGLSLLLRQTFEETARRIAFGLPPLAAAAALALFLGWVVAFLMNLLQTRGLSIVREQHTLRIGGGILTRKRYSLRLDDISFIDIRQSLLTRLLRLYSVYLNAIGFGKEQEDLAAIVPFAPKRHVLSHLSRVLPEYTPSDRTISPGQYSYLKYLLTPALVCVSVLAATIYGMRLLPGWSEIIRFAGLMAVLPVVWFFGVRLLDFRSAGLSKEEKYYTLRYSNGFYLHTVIVPWEKITTIELRQSFFQRRANLCDLTVQTRAEGRKRHRLRAVPLDACRTLFGLQTEG